MYVRSVDADICVFMLQKIRVQSRPHGFIGSSGDQCSMSSVPFDAIGAVVISDVRLV